MDVEPLKISIYKYQNYIHSENKLLFGFDQGCSLIKIVYIDKHEAELVTPNAKSINITGVLFKIESLEHALRYTKSRAYIPEHNEEPIHCTGVGSFRSMKLIENIFNRKTVFIYEGLAIAAGIQNGFKYIGVEQLEAQNIELKDYGKFQGKVAEKFEQFVSFKRGQIKEQTDDFPCLILTYGSASGLLYFDENGIGCNLSNIMNGGKSFMGLAKCLLDTNDYSEMVSLANLGKKSNVDTLFSEQFDDQYGFSKLPLNLSIFPFGKSMEYNIGLETFSKADVAASLIGYQANEILMFCNLTAAIKQLKKIYIFGNIFNCDIIKSEILSLANTFHTVPDIRILDYGFCCSIGAMTTTNEEKDSYFVGPLGI